MSARLQVRRRAARRLAIPFLVGILAWMPSSAVANATSRPSPTGDLLAKRGIWTLPQPRHVSPVAGSFDLRDCKGIRCLGPITTELQNLAGDLAASLTSRTGIRLAPDAHDSSEGSILLAVCPDGTPPAGLRGITSEDLKGIGPQGYALHVDDQGVVLAARGVEGLRWSVRSLLQMATDRAVLAGMHVRDWPALPYRGAHLDICRGQVPTLATLKRLVDVLAEARLNLLELYIEHTFKFRRHPDISPPEGLSPEEGRELFDYAARRGIEVHPMFQVLGHSYHILSKPQYQHLRVGPCEKQPWIMTFDVRKPEAVALVSDLIDELCETFPGKFLNVDITEIDCDGLKAAGLTVEQITDLVFDYVLKLNAVVKRHGMRLMIAQGPLDSTGHLAGMGPKLKDLPKDIIVGSYYCAGGVYQPAWEKDYPRLRAAGLDFFAQAWIDSHIRILPWVGHAADFSDLEVRRGLAQGAMGSTTTDWGDEGHFHFTGQTWYPFLYHGASAWTGAQVDRVYFDQAFTRLLYGIPDDSVARAIQLAGNINGQKLKTRDASGKVFEKDSYHFWEFFRDPFTDPEITALADPGETGRQILAPADQAVRLLETALSKATRNRDNLEQLLFGARCYQAMGRKLVMLGHHRDSSYPRPQLRTELDDLIQTYEQLQKEFRRLWLAEDRENDTFRGMTGWFDQTLTPCRRAILDLDKPGR